MSPPDALRAAAGELSNESGFRFQVSTSPVEGTELFVVYATDYPLPDRYSAATATATFGFRVPSNFPDANPEDCFFLQAADLKLRAKDPVRNDTAIHRASLTVDFLKGTELAAGGALVFSWHLWNTRPWNRRTHRLADHYTHCVRRFDHAEHD